MTFYSLNYRTWNMYTWIVTVNVFSEVSVSVHIRVACPRCPKELGYFPSWPQSFSLLRMIAAKLAGSGLRLSHEFHCPPWLSFDFVVMLSVFDCVVIFGSPLTAHWAMFVCGSTWLHILRSFSLKRPRILLVVVKYNVMKNPVKQEPSLISSNNAIKTAHIRPTCDLYHFCQLV